MMTLQQANTSRLGYFFLFCILAIYASELIHTAWITDDAFFTLRTVLNFVDGNGPNFNADERVQAYTHPLWFLLLSFLTLFFHNVFVVTFIVSIVISMGVMLLLLFNIALSTRGAIVAGLILILSKCYVDFSTSGLENPLSHLLILFAVMFARQYVATEKFSWFCAFFLDVSCLYLSRPDLCLLMLPLAIVLIMQSQFKTALILKGLLIGALPAVLWTVFSVVYYGFPFPNTAYAKLGNDIPLPDLMHQGLNYLLDSLYRDPITLAMCMLGFLLGIQSTSFNKALSLGALLYIVYIITIGGDFMSGRFLTAPLLVFVIILSSLEFSKRNCSPLSTSRGLSAGSTDGARFLDLADKPRDVGEEVDARAVTSKQRYILLIVYILVLGLVNLKSTVMSNAQYANETISASGIADERGFYYQTFGMLPFVKDILDHTFWVMRENEVQNPGFAGIQKLRSHQFDLVGLVDPLLARLPPKYEPHWRIGHFERQIPTNYPESLRRDKNLLVDRDAYLYYEAIRHVTRGPLWTKQRWIDIIRLNFDLIKRPDSHYYRFENVPRASYGVLRED